MPVKVDNQSFFRSLALFFPATALSPFRFRWCVLTRVSSVCVSFLSALALQEFIQRILCRRLRLLVLQVNSLSRYRIRSTFLFLFPPARTRDHSSSQQRQLKEDRVRLLRQCERTGGQERAEKASMSRCASILTAM